MEFCMSGGGLFLIYRGRPLPEEGVPIPWALRTEGGTYFPCEVSASVVWTNSLVAIDEHN